VSAYGEFTTVMSEERYLVEGLTAMGYRVEVHADGAALVGYHGDERRETAHVIIRRAQLDSASNDIGFVRGKDGRYQAILSEIWLTKPRWRTYSRPQPRKRCRITRTMRPQALMARG